MELWLATIDVDLFVTLGLGQSAFLRKAQQQLGHWLACLDSHYLGRNWVRRSSAERTFAIAIPENIDTNLHYHCLLRLPAWGRNQEIAETEVALQHFWHRIVPRGSCDVEQIYDLPGVVRYVTKQLVRPGYHRHYLLASEFHPKT